METSTANSKIYSALALPNSPEFAFITITHPKDIKDVKNKAKVRSHARRSTIRPKEHRRKHLQEIVFNLPESESLSQLQMESNMVPGQPASICWNDVTSVFEWIRADIEEDDEGLSSSLSFLRPIGYGRGLNPLVTFPELANARIQHIFNYVLLSKKKAYKPLLNAWFALTMFDESTFELVMANAAIIYGADAGDKQQETAESMKYYNMSLQSVNKRLKDPVDGVSEGVMGTVVGFACHEHMIGNYQRVNVHLNGLEKIISARGGIETLKLFHILRRMVIRIDISNSLVTDTPPRFPLPMDLVHHFTNSHYFHGLTSIITAWNTAFPNFPEASQLLSKIAQMAQYINDTIGSTPLSLWRDEWFMVQNFQPILYEALSLPRMDLDQLNVAPESVLREAIRLTCLILLSAMNRKFRVSLDGIPIYRDEVMKLLVSHPVAWCFFLDLKLWVLVFGGLVTEGEVRAWHISEILATMEQLGLTTWEAVYSIVKDILWVDDLLQDEREKLGLDVQDFIRQ